MVTVFQRLSWRAIRTLVAETSTPSTERSGCRAASAMATPPSPQPASSTRFGLTASTARSSSWNSGSRPRRSTIFRVFFPVSMRRRFSMSLSPIFHRRPLYCSSWAAM